MYPQTTSLYPATIVDNLVYCKEEENIVVVEFDGDEGMCKLSNLQMYTFG